MSLRLHDEHRIVLRPDRVILARMKREFTRHGWERNVRSIQEVPCLPTSGEDLPWSGALGALESVLSGLSGRKPQTTVVLSNHFMRYVLIPASDALFDAKEEKAYAQHSFREMYGRDSNDWELCISSGGIGNSQMASAVDARLLESLRGLFARVGGELESIQPHLMLAYNACRNTLRDRSVWLALIEHGNLCLAVLQDGRWSWVRTMRIGARWHEELPLLLEREAFNANVGAGINEVLLWAPEYAAGLFPPGGKWNVQHLQPSRMPSLSPEIESRFAMYMCGECQ